MFSELQDALDSLGEVPPSPPSPSLIADFENVGNTIEHDAVSIASGNTIEHSVVAVINISLAVVGLSILFSLIEALALIRMPLLWPLGYILLVLAVSGAVQVGCVTAMIVAIANVGNGTVAFSEVGTAYTYVKIPVPIFCAQKLMMLAVTMYQRQIAMRRARTQGRGTGFEV